MATKQLRGGARLAAIDTWLDRLLDKWGGATLAAVEGYAMAAQNRPFDLGEVGGVVRLRLFQRGIPYVVVPPTQVKKFATGSGQATKKQVQAAIKARWGLGITQEDQADAFVLSRIAYAVATGITSTAREAEVVARLTSPKAPPVTPRIPRLVNI